MELQNAITEIKEIVLELKAKNKPTVDEAGSMNKKSI